MTISVSLIIFWRRCHKHDSHIIQATPGISITIARLYGNPLGLLEPIRGVIYRLKRIFNSMVGRGALICLSISYRSTRDAVSIINILADVTEKVVLCMT
jgi:hypothetical protein